MTVSDDEILIVSDRRHDDNAAGAVDIQIESKLMSIRSGGSWPHRLLFFREQDAREVYEQLDRLFGDDSEGDTE